MNSLVLLQFPLLLLGLLAAAVLVVIWLPFRWRAGAGSIPGSFNIEGRIYIYEMGDHLLRYGGASEFAGIEIGLPKRLPHIFLDAHQNDRGVTHEYIYDTSNRLSLEGDFDRYFQAYVPAQHKVLALSILTPDVLQVLMQSVNKFDVEIINDKVCLMVPGKQIARDGAAKNELLHAAETLLIEIDHRLQSWSESSMTGDTMLDIRASRAMPVAGRWWLRRKAAAAWTLGILAAASTIIAHRLLQ